MIERKAHLDTLAVSLLLGCCLFWGFQQVLIKATIAEIAPPQDVYQEPTSEARSRIESRTVTCHNRASNR